MKRLLKKLGIKIYRSFSLNNRKGLGDNEIKASAICRKLINLPHSKFLIAPISKKRYIKNEKLKMFVIISDNKINIVNHVYSYDIPIREKLYYRLAKIFDNKVDSQRIAFEDEINSQIEFSLSNIIKKL
jgi:hypothetical protein